MSFLQQKLQRAPLLIRYLGLMLLIALGMSLLVILVIEVCNWKPGEVGLLAIFSTIFGWFVGYKELQENQSTRPQASWKELTGSERSLFAATLLSLTVVTFWLAKIAFHLVASNLTWR